MVAAVDLHYMERTGAEMIGKAHSRARSVVGFEAATNSQPDGSWSVAKLRRAQIQEKAAVGQRKALGFEQLVDRTGRP